MRSFFIALTFATTLAACADTQGAPRASTASGETVIAQHLETFT